MATHPKLDPVRNGVDTAALFTTLDAVTGKPELATFQFRATNTWISGTHSRSMIDGYSGAGGEQRHAQAFRYDADHPPELTGHDVGPTPVEFLLHALAACLTAGLVNIAAARGVTLRAVSSTVEGDINLLGVFGLDREVRNGYEAIRVHLHVEGDASAEELRALVMRATARSAVYDALTYGTRIVIDTTTGITIG
jgi:uncharacterized OsmC-like protein